jgi:hypothetical protein
MCFDEHTRAYVERRTREGLNKKDIMRCLKRFVAREVYRALTTRPTERITQADLAPTSLRPLAPCRGSSLKSSTWCSGVTPVVLSGSPRL